MCAKNCNNEVKNDTSIKFYTPHILSYLSYLYQLLLYFVNQLFDLKSQKGQKLSITYQQRKALKRLRVQLFRKDMRRWKAQELREKFAASSSKRIVRSRLMRCIVYQAATWMQRGKVPKVEGNLRSLFYQWIKPIVVKLPELQSAKTDPYHEMLNVLETFTAELKLFKYRDLDIIDENWENRWYTNGRNPHIIFFAEKNGFIRILQEVHEKYGVTTISLGGFPSHLSSEYLVEGLRKRIQKIEPIVLLGITDFDPSGYFIERSFSQQLTNQGLEINSSQSLITPDQYTKSSLEIFQYPIPSKYPARIRNWLKETGGINGEPFGLESDSMPKVQLRKLIHQRITPHLKTP
jgi:hypothetical protein